MKKLITIFSVVVFFAACQKESSTTFTLNRSLDINDTSWANKPISSIKIDSFNATFNPLMIYVDSFSCNKGDTMHVGFSPYQTDFIFPPSAYGLINGSAIADGTIRVEIFLLSRKGDYIKTLIPTSSNNKILEVERCFFVKLYKQGQEISLLPNQSFTVRWNDSQANTSAKFFEGSLITNQDSLITWKSSGNGNVRTVYYPGSTTYVKGYEIVSNITHWNGCLNYMDTTAGTTRINVSLPPNYTNKNTITFAVFKNKYAVTRLSPDFLSRTFFATGIPLNSQLSIISISLIDNMLYFGISDVTVSNANVISVKPQLKSARDIIAILDGL
jgi:hypothetical protein